MSLLFCYRFDGDARAAEEGVALAGADMFGLGLDDDDSLDESGGGEAAGLGLGNGFGVKRRVGFVKQNGEQSGGVEDLSEARAHRKAGRRG